MYIGHILPKQIGLYYQPIQSIFQLWQHTLYLPSCPLQSSSCPFEIVKLVHWIGRGRWLGESTGIHYSRMCPSCSARFHLYSTKVSGGNIQSFFLFFFLFSKARYLTGKSYALLENSDSFGKSYSPSNNKLAFADGLWTMLHSVGRCLGGNSEKSFVWIFINCCSSDAIQLCQMMAIFSISL